MFRFEQRLSDWPDCFLEVCCPHCRQTVVWPVPLLLARGGDPSFRELARRLRCSGCGEAAAPVYLCAGHHRTNCSGPTADWAVEIVPELVGPVVPRHHGHQQPKQRGRLRLV